MTIETSNQEVITNFLLEVTQAITFQELAKAYKIIAGDFNKMNNKDNRNILRQFLERYQILAKEADNILQKDSNGKEPSAEQIAIFGEMIILRDFCKNRLNKLSQ